MSISVLDRPVEILLVEDNPSDVRMVREALKEGQLHNNLHVVGDGKNALAFLRNEGDFQGAPCPDFILTDINLPKLNGLEMLAKIKMSPELKHIPVFVLSTSKSKKDIIKSYELQANCYFTKPVDLNQFIAIVQSIEQFWLTIVRLPEGC
jgi:CheY-like chemotaxis protein